MLYYTIKLNITPSQHDKNVFILTVELQKSILFDDVCVCVCD